MSKLSKYFGGGNHLKYDLLKFAKHLTGSENLIFEKLFYYNAPPNQSSNPSPREKKMKEKYDSFISSLSREEKIVIREGRCQRLKENGRIYYKQKGVDTFLTMDLMEIPLNYPKIKNVILIASDSDFVPVIERLKERGINVLLVTYFDRKRDSDFSTSNQLLESVTRYKLLTKKDFEVCPRF